MTSNVQGLRCSKTMQILAADGYAVLKKSPEEVNDDHNVEDSCGEQSLNRESSGEGLFWCALSSFLAQA